MEIGFSSNFQNINNKIVKNRYFISLLYLFIFWIGFYAKTFSCDLDPGLKGNEITPKTICAPLEVDFYVSYGDFPVSAGDKIDIYIDWDDGNYTWLPAILNNVGVIDKWEVTASYTYPKGGNKCNYYPTAILAVNGQLCYSSMQTQMVRVWDTDDENGGEIIINPVVEPICYGSDGHVTFHDYSQWNCVPPNEYDFKNTEKRWIQWVYGTGGTTITDAQVNGTARVFPYEGPIEVTHSPIEAPSFPWNQSMEIYIPDYYEVGDLFEVTLRNWNQCNPYPSHDPVETTAIALVVALPDGSVAAVGPFCDNESRVRLDPATSGGTWDGPGISNPNRSWFYPDLAGPGNHTINYFVTDANGCSASGKVEIEVRESPVINLIKGPSYYLCPGINQELEVEIFGGKPPLDILWTGDIGPLSSTTIANPIFETTETGIFNLVVTVSDDQNCQSSENISIEVEPVEVSFNPPLVSVCQNEAITLKPITNGGSKAYISHLWTGDRSDLLSDTNIENPVFISDEIGSFLFTYQVIDDMGCMSESEITVITKQQPLVNAGDDDEICKDEYVLNASSIPAVPGLWQKTEGIGNISFSDETDPGATVTVDQAGEYSFTWRVDLDGCIAEDKVSILFANIPEPDIMDELSVCGLESTLEAFPDLGTGEWSMLSGPGNSIFSNTSSPLTEVSVSEPGEYTFQWTEVTDNYCEGKASTTVTFMPQAHAIVDPLPEKGCSPYPVTFHNKSINADNYHWDLGGGAFSTEKDLVFIYENLTDELRIHQVTLTVSNTYDCNDSYTFPVEVAPSPRARASAEPTAGCSPLAVSFHNNSTGAKSFEWNFGDSSEISIEMNPRHIFYNNESYVEYFPISLVVENEYGCRDSTQVPITVYPSPIINVEARPDEGCSPINVSLSASSGLSGYAWDLGDGTIYNAEKDIQHLFKNESPEAQVFNISVTGTNNFACEATASTQVLVYPSPSANFMVEPNEMQMPERTITLSNLTEGEGWEYRWDTGDGNSYSGFQPPMHQYTISGTYTISLEAYNEWCRDIMTQEIIIHPMKPEIIHYGNPSSGCPPLSVSFENNSLDATGFLWDFGDGLMSQNIEPEHTYWAPGIYKVTLTASGPGGSSTADDLEIIVYENPIALFEVNPGIIYIPDDNASIINRSIGGSSWHWDFGDGTSSEDFSPPLEYTKPGVYDITLTVVSENGCIDSYALREAIKVEQGGEVVFPNAFTPNPDGPSGGRYTKGDRKNHVFYPSIQKGVWEYKLQIFTRWGELIFESKDLNIGWDGYHHNRLAQQGVYIYRVSYKTADGKVRIMAGDVTLIR